MNALFPMLPANTLSPNLNYYINRSPDGTGTVWAGDNNASAPGAVKYDGSFEHPVFPGLPFRKQLVNGRIVENTRVTKLLAFRGLERTAVELLYCIDPLTPGLSGSVAARRRGIGPGGQRRAGTALIARGEFSIVIAGLAVAAQGLRQWQRAARLGGVASALRTAQRSPLTPRDEPTAWSTPPSSHL